MTDLFADRAAGGRILAQLLTGYAGRSDVVVLALPRGGVPVAREVALTLRAPLDILLVRKLGVPQSPELAMGAIASGGALYVDPLIVASAHVGREQLDAIIAAEGHELARREARYLGTAKRPRLEGNIVIVVDDGIATGASMCAALLALRSAKPAWVVVAVPVAPREAQERIGTAADEFVCALSADDFHSVSQFYRDFRQTSDEEVRALLGLA